MYSSMSWSKRCHINIMGIFFLFQIHCKKSFLIAGSENYQYWYGWKIKNGFFGKSYTKFTGLSFFYCSERVFIPCVPAIEYFFHKVLQSKKQGLFASPCSLKILFIFNYRPQISFAYSVTALSAENIPAPAILFSDI